MADAKGKRPRKVKPPGADGHRARMLTKFRNSVDREVLPRDIVEMLLYYSIRVRDTRDDAVLLMEAFDGDIRRMLDAPMSELQKTDGIGPSSALLLNLAGHIANRLESDDADPRPRLMTCDDIGSFFFENYTAPEEDELWGAFFDNAMRPILQRFKTAPIEMYAEDIFELLSLAAQHHSNLAAVAHMIPRGVKYPCATDIMISQYIEESIKHSNLSMIEYFVVDSEGYVRIKPLYTAFPMM